MKMDPTPIGSGQRMTRLYAQHCNRSYEEFERAMDRYRFMTPE